jgi:hypothetical protein
VIDTSFGNRWTSGVLAVALILALSSGAQANLVTNGSFENVTGASIDNWVLVLDARSDAASDFGTGSPYGSLVLAFNAETLDVGGGSATQDFGTTETGVTYMVSFAYAQIGGAPNAQTLGVTINTTSVPIPQQLFTDSSPTNDLSTGWKRGSFTFVGNGLATGITFTDAIAATGSDLIVDDVSIVAVPEATPLLLLCGAGVVTLLISRRRAR